MKYRLFIFLLITILLFSGCRHSVIPPESGTDTPTEETTAIPLPEEMRGVWLSYLDLEEMLKSTNPAAALDDAMKTCQQWRLNTVFFHVRANSDAFYNSSVFPAAHAAEDLLAQGFDPLAYAVDCAHKHGIALHAWINPYRIGKDKTAAQLSSEDAIFEKNGIWYYNPACEEARRLILDGVRELLQRYHVDGIHFDDYFYPAGLDSTGECFETIPDGFRTDSWRCTQVDTLISGVYSMAHQYGRVFGVSPIALIDRCRSQSYADVTAWLTQPGYVDYLCPQIYFGFEHSTHPFDATLQEWTALSRRKEVALYVGLALYKAGTDDDPYAGDGRREWAQQNDILSRQITAVRACEHTNGFVLFRYAQLVATDDRLIRERTNMKAIL